MRKKHGSENFAQRYELQFQGFFGGGKPILTSENVPLCFLSSSLMLQYWGTPYNLFELVNRIFGKALISKL